MPIKTVRECKLPDSSVVAFAVLKTVYLQIHRLGSAVLAAGIAAEVLAVEPVAAGDVAEALAAGIAAEAIAAVIDQR